MKKRLNQYHSILYRIAVLKNQLIRYVQWYFSKRHYAAERCKNVEKFPYEINTHSLLLRKPGSVDMKFQYHKAHNLSIMAPRINNVIIKPAQYFS